MLIARLRSLYRNLFRRTQADADLDEELRAYVDELAAEHRGRGLSNEDAYRAARLDLRGSDHVKDSVRDAWAGAALTAAVREFRYAVRSIAHSPSYVVSVVLVLSLGFALNAIVFGIVDAALFRPLPYRAPERLIRVEETINGLPGSVSWASFDAWRRGVTSFSDVVAYDNAIVTVGGGSEPERTVAIVATPNLFRALGVAARVGRTFGADDGGPGQSLVAVLSAAFWKNAFGGDSTVIGHTIDLNGAPCTIVGVAPTDFSFPALSETAMWIPSRPTAKELVDRADHHLSVIARLRDGATMNGANAELQTVVARMATAYPAAQRGRGARLVGVRDAATGAARGQLLALFGAVVIVLLIACTNVANLTLARAVTRRHEFAVRLALGAGRRHLVGEVVAEGIVLVGAAAALGAIGAVAASGVIRGLVRFAFPFDVDVRFDARAFAFLCVGSLIAIGITGAIPAILAGRRTDLRSALSATSARSTGGHAGRARRALVATQVALSLMLVVGAGLLVRTVIALGETAPGFDASGVMTAHVPTEGATQGAPVAGFFRPLLDRLRATPGVVAAGAISLLPLQEAWTNGGFRVIGAPPQPAGKQALAEYRVVSPGYFDAMRIPILAGRAITERDDASPGRGTGPDSVGRLPDRVILVNAALARRFLVHNGRLTDAIGRQLLDIGFSAPATIVGVVGDVRQADLQLPALPEIYFPYAAMDDGPGASNMVLVVRSSLGQDAGAAIRRAVAALDPSRPVSLVRSMDSVVAESVAKQRLYALLLGLIGVAAVILTAAGVYAVLSYVVAERRREVGLRLALGAQGGDVLHMIVGEAMRVAGLGLLVGAAGSALLTRTLRSAIYGVTVTDPMTFWGSTALIALVALAASYIPAHRAARIDPLVALKSD